ncbi:MAG: hypothetical protein J6S44_06535 [Clostridia bacterium]|nr:hypothetical protein [Clostridia bacterium]
MKFYTASCEAMGKKVALSDMILTKDMPTAAGSKMLAGYYSLFDATVAEKLAEGGYSVCGKAGVGEFAIDLYGETAAEGVYADESGRLLYPAAEILKEGSAMAVVSLDANGAERRAAAVEGLTFVKPTYGTVSRFGTVAAACSGETVGVMAKTAEACKEVLSAIRSYDEKDGTSLPLSMRKEAAPIKRVALLTAFVDKADEDVKACVKATAEAIAATGVAVEEIDGAALLKAGEAWNVLMCAELCNNVSRYDGVKYGYRTKNYKTIEELYTNSRSEAFGLLLKAAILYGSDVLSTDKYETLYDKSLRIRRVLLEKCKELFASYDALLLPATTSLGYTEAEVKADAYLCFKENVYTAPASITGLPTVVTKGVQLLGDAFSEDGLLALAAALEKEGTK